MIELETGETVVGDTASSDSGDVGETDTSITEDNEAIASFYMGEVTPGSTLVLNWLNPLEEQWAVGEAVYSSSVEGGVHEVYIPAPTQDELVTWSEDAGWKVAWYVPTIFHDDNSDGVFSDGEAVYGVGEYWLFYSNLSLPDYGIEFGWNAHFLLGDQFLAPFDLNIEENLVTRDSISISGNMTGIDQSSLNPRLAAIPATIFNGQPVSEFLYDSDLEQNWEIQINQAPALDHFQYNPDMNNLLALEILAVYDDSESNEVYDLADQIITGVCRDNRSVSLVYIGPPSDLLGNIVFALQKFVLGWSALESWITPDGTEQSTFIDNPESISFGIGGPCWAE